MKCPFCGYLEDKVVDSRESKDGSVIRRRRECQQCTRRFTSYEKIEDIPYMVVKKDQRREPFDRHKLLSGIRRACEKRPVKVKQLEAICDEVEALLQSKPDKEIASQEIGEYMVKSLKKLDKVAYVRFASVYREFKDIDEFMEELKALKEGMK